MRYGKCGGLYDVEVWRFIQSLGTLGPARVYAPAHEPAVDALTEFLQGVQLIRKRVREDVAFTLLEVERLCCRTPRLTVSWASPPILLQS